MLFIFAFKIISIMVAPRGGFELPRGKAPQAFQACALDRWATSAQAPEYTV